MEADVFHLEQMAMIVINLLMAIQPVLPFTSHTMTRKQLEQLQKVFFSKFLVDAI